MIYTKNSNSEITIFDSRGNIICYMKHIIDINSEKVKVMAYEFKHTDDWLIIKENDKIICEIPMDWKK